MIKIHSIQGTRRIAIIVPTLSATGSLFEQFMDSLSKTTEQKPTVISVESHGPEFNYAKSINAGIHEAMTHNPDFLILSNDDIVFFNGWLDSLLSCFDVFQKLGYVIPSCSTAKGDLIPTLVKRPSWPAIHMYVSLQSIIPFIFSDSVARSVGRVQNLISNRVAIQDRIGSHFSFTGYGLSANSAPLCVLPTSVFDRIGLFDELFQVGGEDLDFTIRTYLSGYQVALDIKSKIHHLASASINKTGGYYRSRYVRDRAVKNWRRILQKYTPQQYAAFLRACATQTVTIHSS
ncbi:MAG: hypothetical protein JRN15_14240 [Nitrososphaerota archaeon]|nr:hypothetical protein [Nitrososphaerota archaeon]